ncbi:MULTISPECIES: hypothetical protein [unclassified Archaeoglobus]|jgi:hypothetical protein|uniref:hypothetical protein n=1 Tax=unclassified Archaeoglobus TaxID=2643606 RepID=UPI0025C249F0|nr:MULTISPECIES: hypothetical protein [unclassified Archaeoglobus]
MMDYDVLDRFCEAVEAFREWWEKNRKNAPHRDSGSAGAIPAGSRRKGGVVYGGEGE